jgi:hypothetical protein
MTVMNRFTSPAHLCTGLAVTILLSVPDPLGAEEKVLRQNFTGDNPYTLITQASDIPDQLIQKSGIWKSDKAYSQQAYEVGFHIQTGTEVAMSTQIPVTEWNCSHVIGAHGKGTVVRFTGHWQGDGGSSFPNLVLSEEARFIITPEAHIDYVLADSFYTRQLWAYGDGTGTIEIEEGFLADRTNGGTVEDAMGTIRLNGVHLVTHHSRNLPFNTRPDGRGAIYPNGHIVWEGQPGSTWTVETHPQIYPAQLDFHVDGTINCQAHLTHNGQKLVTAPEMVGGVFTSTGAFRTCEPDVTITKTGPGMLALDGQQGYYPGAALMVHEGTLKMSTNPGNGYRYDSNAGAYLSITADANARVLLSAERSDLQAMHLKGQSKLYTFSDSTVNVADGITIGPEAMIYALGTYQTNMTVEGTWRADAEAPVTVTGNLDISGPLRIGATRRLMKAKPDSIPLINATTLQGKFSNAAEGSEVHVMGDQIKGTIHYREHRVLIENLVYTDKKKKKKKKQKKSD